MRQYARLCMVARHAVVAFAALVVVAAAGELFAAAPASGPLKVHPDNPRYFADAAGRAVLLAGSHTWPNLVDMGPTDPPPKFDFDAHLDFLQRHGHNYTRLWTWEPVSWNTKGNRQNLVHNAWPQPFDRTGPAEALDGKPRFDLTKYNTEYFNRLRSRVEAAGRRGIYVSVMLFEGWAMQFSPGAWEGHPFNPANNINNINGDVDGDGKGLEVHELKNPAVTAIQEAYVRKTIETVGDLDNVFYEISNENHPQSTEWQYHMIRFIHDYEKTRPKRHPVGMTFQYKGGSNQALLDSPAEWISPNPDGGYRDNPPPADGRKVVLSDTDHLWGIGGNQAWVWKTVTRGHNPLFMDPCDGTVLGPRADDKWDPVRRNLGFAVRLAGRVNLAAMTPMGELSSSKYCLAGVTGKAAEYIVYLPEGGKVAVDLSGAAGKLNAEWLEPATGKTTAGAPVDGGAKRDFTAPFAGDAVLFLSTRK